VRKPPLGSTARGCARTLAATLRAYPSATQESVVRVGVKLSHVYFPTSAIVSLLYVMENGASAEITDASAKRLLYLTICESDPWAALLVACKHHLAKERRYVID
jgi:hypothetical protein